jgi:hypothetical protein
MTAYKRTEASQLFKMQMQLLMISLQHWTPLETQIESNMRILYNWMRRNPDDMYSSRGAVDSIRELPYFCGLTP